MPRLICTAAAGDFRASPPSSLHERSHTTRATYFDLYNNFYFRPRQKTVPPPGGRRAAPRAPRVPGAAPPRQRRTGAAGDPLPPPWRGARFPCRFPPTRIPRPAAGAAASRWRTRNRSRGLWPKVKRKQVDAAGGVKGSVAREVFFVCLPLSPVCGRSCRTKPGPAVGDFELFGLLVQTKFPRKRT